MSFRLGYAASKLLELYKWDKVALLYYKSEVNHCGGVMNDVETTFNDPSTYSIQIVLKAEIDASDNVTTNAVISSVKTRARSK